MESLGRPSSSSAPPARPAAASSTASPPAASPPAAGSRSAETLDGRSASGTDGVQRALGRPLRDFRDYARAAAATGVWRPQA